MEIRSFSGDYWTETFCTIEVIHVVHILSDVTCSVTQSSLHVILICGGAVSGGLHCRNRKKQYLTSVTLSLRSQSFPL